MKYTIIVIVVVAIIVIIVRLRGNRTEIPENRPVNSAKPILRQIADLCPRDFEQHPIWVSCHIVDYDEPWYDETDEETFRPWDKEIPVNPTETFLVKATISLADGTEIPGFVTPQSPTESGGKPYLGTLQPRMFLPDGNIAIFWYGIVSPTDEEIRQFYTVLSKNQQEVFPAKFKAVGNLATGITAGVIPGFCTMGANESIITKQ